MNQPPYDQAALTRLDCIPRSIAILPILLILLPIAATQSPILRSICATIERPAATLFPVLTILRADHIYGPAGRSAILIGIIAGLYLTIYFARITPRRFRILNYSLVNAIRATQGRQASLHLTSQFVRARLRMALFGLILITSFSASLIIDDIAGYINWANTTSPYWYALQSTPFFPGTVLSGQGVIHSVLYDPIGSPNHLLHAITTGLKLALAIGGTGMILVGLTVILANLRAIRHNTTRDLASLSSRNPR
ncbi:MAG: hypothetical protein PHT60_05930 [Acidiphilium sp.]|nr:hypothetical protein [Acidiphilium sp.]MDD4935302.1 hypothetical protein [Acidiphilium sp.]